jgi:GTPase SAR1 family protein
MPDYSLAPCVTLVFGRSGSGKTTFCFRYLANALTAQPANGNPAACVFIFDWKLEAAQKFGVAACGTEAQCVAAMATRLVIFNPFVMFQPEPGKELPEKRAFKWFCQWVFSMAKTGPGKKILFADELAMFIDRLNSQMPYELQLIVRQGRAENLELLTATQYPKDYPPDVRKGVTEWVCFNTNEPEDLDAIRPYFRGVDVVTDFPAGEFIAYNRASGAELRGKLF